MTSASRAGPRNCSFVFYFSLSLFLTIALEGASANVSLPFESMQASSLPLPELEFPLQPVHLSPSSLPFTPLPLPEELGYHPIICFSASKCIESDEQRQRDGWRYEQGAGDDHELWGSGLEATDFWRLIEEEVGWETWSNEELEQVIGERLRARVGTVGVERETEGEATVDVVRPTGWIHLSILPLSTSTLLDYACIILSSKISPSTTDVSPSTVLEVKSKPPKSALPSPVDLQRALTFARSSIQAGKKVVVACENGKDASVGVGLVLLQGLFSTDGRLLDETHLRMSPDLRLTPALPQRADDLFLPFLSCRRSCNEAIPLEPPSVDHQRPPKGQPEPQDPPTRQPVLHERRTSAVQGCLSRALNRRFEAVEKAGWEGRAARGLKRQAFREARFTSSRFS